MGIQKKGRLAGLFAVSVDALRENDRKFRIIKDLGGTFKNTHSNRPIMKKLISCLVVFLLPTLAFGWSSIEPYSTHNEVTLLALTAMPNDNASRVKPLSAANRILYFDQAHIENMRPTGTSPDADTNSTYSEHYFSPSLGWGEAPNSVTRNFGILLSADPKSDAAANAAAYAAPFLADIHVPYHVQQPKPSTDREWYTFHSHCHYCIFMTVDTYSRWIPGEGRGELDAALGGNVNGGEGGAVVRQSHIIAYLPKKVRATHANI